MEDKEQEADAKWAWTGAQVGEADGERRLGLEDKLGGVERGVFYLHQHR